ncbi:hypothetical protein PGTUg99_004457 [Puccinia graminis f. sp. tritici]|uniref:Uncharacterized protein n=1 Tax=Puccinia graminis f. sp. tritici TaxID=56615 RepID=A0A5B0NAS3_PUCGR|nr:hypothetical protein PGTUg99_004457 [Puccinia graminis f. sp. tritici]
MRASSLPRQTHQANSQPIATYKGVKTLFAASRTHCYQILAKRLDFQYSTFIFSLQSILLPVFDILFTQQHIIKMQSSIVLLACWLLSVELVLAKSSLKLDDNDFIRRLHTTGGKPHPGSRSRRSLVERERASTSDNAETSYQDRPTSSDGLLAALSSGISLDLGYTSAPVSSLVPVSSSPPVSFQTPPPSEPQAATASLASVQPAALPVSSTPTFDKTHTKSEINRVLIQSEAQLKMPATLIQANVTQVTKENAAQIGSQIATNLKDILAHLKVSLTNVQLCGTDAKPLSADKGINLSDVSWSAFQVVLTLKPVFQSVSGLYKPYPVIKNSCSDNMLSISTALASLIGACGEQINLFDTRFFPLVTPQLEEFTSLDDNFVAFVGSFTS